jgi:hypothetical protein
MAVVTIALRDQPSDRTARFMADERDDREAWR